MARKLKDKNIRSLTRAGKRSLYVMLPIEMIEKLSWRERQKVVVSLRNKKITIEDWKG